MVFLSVMIYAVLAFLLIYGLQYRRAANEGEYFQSFNSLRGLFAIEIVVGHVIRYEKTWLYPLGKFMLISVAFFFFVSGWGLGVPFTKKRTIWTISLCANAVICSCCQSMLLRAGLLRDS